MRPFSHRPGGLAVSLIPALLLALALTAVPAPSRADDTDPKAGIAALVAEQKRILRYDALDYALRELMWHQSMSILAAYGGYNSYEVEGKEANADDLQRLKNRIQWNEQSLADFKRGLRLDRSISDDEKTRSEAIIAEYANFLAAAGAVVEHLTAGDPEAANFAYRDQSVPISNTIGSDLFTLSRAAQDRFNTTARQFR